MRCYITRSGLSLFEMDCGRALLMVRWRRPRMFLVWRWGKHGDFS